MRIIHRSSLSSQGDYLFSAGSFMEVAVPRPSKQRFSLLKYNVSIEALDTDGLTPLAHCLITEASDADIEIAAVLIENAHRRIGGYPVLHWAIIGSQPSP
jgi:hypothetical protein